MPDRRAGEPRSDCPDLWAELDPPYRTIVADPPWRYEQGGPHNQRRPGLHGIPAPPYSMMNVAEIAALPIADLAAPDAHLYLWTTSRYLRDAFDVVKAWGWRFSQTLTWCKPPWGIGAGGAFTSTTEFVLFCRRGTLPPMDRINTTWWQWERERPHSTKPAAFMDIVERVSPGPYVELFSRTPRIGWDSWGYGYEGAA